LKKNVPSSIPVDRFPRQNQSKNTNFEKRCLGGPVLVLPLGKIGVRTIQKSLKEDEIIRQIIKLIEQRPNPDVQFSALIDCHDVCLRQVLLSVFFFFI
jgi:hypothetical protein